ncbi:hypothetical protein [Sporosarcina sp. G11-34]|uniref:hypothetical protein n=1 Tax=Sporosarcina sp. G11-34 TaxID=2849605 RepID=UPI0022A90BEC|nr:hypothetical protein [Sporosarcina sp. G11-34]MCZ2259598.1 hypothetical protein [Sporosarcina sp. G11-34]
MTHYAYFASHAPLSVEPMGDNPIKRNTYETALDFTGLYFEENIDEETGKRFSYSKHVKLRYQTCRTSNYLPIDEGYNRNNSYAKKISKLVFNYLMKALEDSPEVVYYISLNSYENEDFKTVRKVHISEIKSDEDLHIGDRECIRIYRDDPMLELLNDDTGFHVLENPNYYGL